MPTLKAAIDASRARAGAKDFTAGTREIVDGATRADQAIRKEELALRRMAQASTATATAASSAGQTIARFLTFAAVTAGVRAATKTIGDFQETMLAVQGVSGATANQMEELTAVARQLGATTRYTATQAAEGLKLFAQAGFSAKAAGQALEPALNLATAGQIDFATAADYTAQALSQYSLDASQAGHVTDVMVMSANSANTSVAQLSEALAYAGSVSGSIGHKIEETAAAIGILSNVGIRASMAGTSVRQMLVQLLDPSKEAEEAIRGLGLTVEQLNPTTHSLTEILNTLAEAQLDAASAAKIFDARNVAAALYLTKHTKQLMLLRDANIEANGTSKALSDLMNTSLSGAVRDMVSAIEGLVLHLGDEGLNDALQGTIRFTTEVIRSLAGITVEGHQASAAVTAVATSARLLVEFTAAFLAFRLAVKIYEIGRAAGVAALSMRAMALANPITAAAVAVGLLVTGIIEYQSAAKNAAEESEKLAKKYDEITDSIADTVAAQSRAQRFGDIKGEIDSLRQRLADTKKLRDDIQKDIDKQSQLNPSEPLLIRRDKLPGTLGAAGDAIPSVFPKIQSDTDLRSAWEKTGKWKDDLVDAKAVIDAIGTSEQNITKEIELRNAQQRDEDKERKVQEFDKKEAADQILAKEQKKSQELIYQLALLRAQGTEEEKVAEEIDRAVLRRETGLDYHSKEIDAIEEQLKKQREITKEIDATNKKRDEAAKAGAGPPARPRPDDRRRDVLDAGRDHLPGDQRARRGPEHRDRPLAHGAAGGFARAVLANLPREQERERQPVRRRRRRAVRVRRHRQSADLLPDERRPHRPDGRVWHGGCLPGDAGQPRPPRRLRRRWRRHHAEHHRRAGHEPRPVPQRRRHDRAARAAADAT